MRESELEVLEQYPIEAESTRKIRGAFFINTKEGTMLLKETKISDRRALLFYTLLCQLEESGKYVDTPILNSENKLISTARDGSRYLLKKWYDGESLWTSKTKNPFLMNAGFHAAIEVLTNQVIPKCADMGDFKVETMYKILNLGDYLLIRSELKNLDGKYQRKAIVEYLESSINKILPEENEYSF